MKNIFENAEIELVFFEAGDVMTTSNGQLDGPPIISDNQLGIAGPGTEQQQHE